MAVAQNYYRVKIDGRTADGSRDRKRDLMVGMLRHGHIMV